MDNKIYVMEECLAPGVWVLLSNVYYTSKDDADKALQEIYKTMEKYKKDFKARVTEISNKSNNIK